MAHHRALGILASILLIPQLLGASEVGCSRHDDDQPAAAATQSVAGHENHHDSSGHNTAPPEHHPVSNCCPAMSSCTGGTAIQAVDNALSTWSWHNEAPLDVVMLSRSRVESPDPPPPKA